MSSFAANPTHSSRFRLCNLLVARFLLSLPKGELTRNGTKLLHYTRVQKRHFRFSSKRIYTLPLKVKMHVASFVL